jgi:GH15 family glucan-1,4-alpha-glucosidase
MPSLDLGVVGNSSYGALVDKRGRVVWCCLPRFDGDPVFCHLLNGGDEVEPSTRGVFEVAVEGLVHSEQSYLPNTAVLVTRLYDEAGGCVEITDFAPRFFQYNRKFRPNTLVRIVRPAAGTPRIRIIVRPAFDYGASVPQITHGSNHIRFVGSALTLRLTVDAPTTYILDEASFLLEEPVSLVLGPDESLLDSPGETAERFLDRTISYWKEWVRQLAVPMEWQEPVIRAAITLKLCSFEDTGAIIGAMTTSVPEAANSGRNWDYRYCWLRDAYFVVRALNRLGVVVTMENYLRYLANVVAKADGVRLQPVYGIGMEERLYERQVETLAGYQGMGPVRVGNQAYQQAQHDTYGHVVMASTQAFFDSRLLRPATERTFLQLETVGEKAFQLFNQPDAGMWELRTRANVHTSSSLMCWAACDRLAKIATHLRNAGRARDWREKANIVHRTIIDRAWNEDLQSFVESFGGAEVDASLLLMREFGFLDISDPRMISTFAMIERRLKSGSHLLRYHAPDDFGQPSSSFIICTFWYIETLAELGREDEARDMFESLLACRNHVGLLSEDVDPSSGRLWGNFPQTYSQVGLINCARQLSKRWEDML